MTLRSLLLSTLASLVALSACSADDPPARTDGGTDGPSGNDASVECTPPAMRCDGQAIDACTGGVWVPSGVVCDIDLGERCAEGVCRRPCDVAALSNSYVGCEYWPTVTTNVVADREFFRFAVVVANPNDDVAHITVDRGGAVVATADVEPGATANLVLPWVMELLDPPSESRRGSANVLLAGGAYHLVSTLPVSAYQFNPFENEVGGRPSFSNDASLLLPTAALGSDYRVVAHASHVLGGGNREQLNPAGAAAQGSPGFFAVVATRDGTSVEVHSAARTQRGPGSDPPLMEGEVRTYLLDRGDVLQVLSKQGFYDEAECVQPAIGGGGCTGGRLTDLTGTTITSSAPVAVFGGHRCVDLPAEWLFCDHLEEQMLPVPTWGTSALAVASEPLKPEEKNIFRVVSAVDGNQVEIVPPVAGPFNLDDGEFVDFEAAEAIEVRGTERLQLVQYETSGMRASIVFGSVPLEPGDPAMALAVPAAQYRRDYIFLSPASFPISYVHVITPTASAAPVLDGVTLDTPTAIPGSSYGWLRVAVAPGAHTIVGVAPFGITVHGVSQACSYMYPGGLDLVPLFL